MAELVKKLKIKTSAGVVEECNLYTTTEESGQNNLKLTVDDISAFVVLGEDLVNASSGRIQNAGVTYNIKTQAKPPYNKVEYRTPGTFTFNVPNNVTTLQISVAGAGGGGLNVSIISANGGNGDLQSATINLAGYGNPTTITITVGKGGQLMTLDNLETGGYKGGSSTITIGTDTITAEGGGGAYILGMANVANGTNAGNGQGGKGGIGAAGENGWVIIEYGGDI